MRKCVKCIDDPGEFTWITGKKYCKPCSSDVECHNCKLELYTSIKDEGNSLEVEYKSDTPITDETKLAWINMGMYTTLYGYEKPKDKSVYNFFQFANSTGKKKGKDHAYCCACLQLLAKKLTFSILHKKKSEPKKKLTRIPFGKESLDIGIFENILSYLTMPKHIAAIEGVCKTWKKYMRTMNSFSWMNELTIEHKNYPTEDPLHFTTQNVVEDAANWDDLKLISVLKRFAKYKNFNGFTNLKSFRIETSVGDTHITDFGICYLVELVRGSTIEYIKLNNMKRVKWLGMHRLFQKSKALKGVDLGGIEQSRILMHCLEDELGREPFTHLESLHIDQCGKLGLSHLVNIAQLENLKTLGITSTTLYWDKENIWESIPVMSKITTLNLTNSFMPLKNSLASLFNFFPNVEHLHADFMQRSNLADKVEMFKKCGSQFTEDIISNLHYVVFPHGTEIITAGAIGHEMYFLLSGKVDVVVNGKVIVTLPAGAFFGEIALLFDTPRTATIRANGLCEVYELSQTDMFRVLRMHPDSKVIIKEEARKRYEQLFGKKSSVNDKKEAPASNKPEKEKKQPPSGDDLVKEATSVYDGKLKSLFMKGIDLEVDFLDMLPHFPLLETLYIEIESHQPIEKELEFPSEPNMLEHLKTLRIVLSNSHLTVTPDGWSGIGHIAPNLQHIHVSEYITSTSLLQIISDLKQLRVLDIPNSPKCGRAIAQALREQPRLCEISSNAKVKADSILKALSKKSELRIVNLTNATFGDAQLKKLIRLCPDIAHISVQTSGLTGIKPEQFKKNAKYQHIDISVNTQTSSKPTLRRQGSTKMSPRRDRHSDSRASLLSVSNTNKSRSKSRPNSRTKKKIRSRSTTPEIKQKSNIKRSRSVDISLNKMEQQKKKSTPTLPKLEKEEDHLSLPSINSSRGDTHQQPPAPSTENVTLPILQNSTLPNIHEPAYDNYENYEVRFDESSPKIDEDIKKLLEEANSEQDILEMDQPSDSYEPLGAAAMTTEEAPSKKRREPKRSNRHSPKRHSPKNISPKSISPKNGSPKRGSPKPKRFPSHKRRKRKTNGSKSPSPKNQSREPSPKPKHRRHLKVHSLQGKKPRRLNPITSKNKVKMQDRIKTQKAHRQGTPVNNNGFPNSKRFSREPSRKNFHKMSKRDLLKLKQQNSIYNNQ